MKQNLGKKREKRLTGRKKERREGRGERVVLGVTGCGQLPVDVQ